MNQTNPPDKGKDDPIYISFYPDEEAQGSPMREVLVSQLHQTDGRLLRQARKKGLKLKAKSFVMFKVIPRIWPVEVADD